MTFTQLQVLMAIAEKGSFTLAAESLSMTQSAVSHALAGLESELGVNLVERDRQKAVLSGVGARVMEDAREILARAENIRQQTAAMRGLAVGKLRLGTYRSTSARLMPGILRQFQQHYPGIEIVFFEGSDQEVHQWILSRAVDLGFVTLPSTEVAAIPLAQDEMLVLLPPRHALAGRSSLQPANLVQEPFILSRGGCERLIMDCFQAARVTLRPQFEVTDFATILAMVQEGVGITIAPRLALPENLSEVEVVPLDPPLFRYLGLGVRSLETLSPAVSSFIEIAQNWTKARGYLPR